MDLWKVTTVPEDENKPMQIHKKLVLAIPALWASIFDSVITIVHQPSEYWDGNLNKANEANPIGNFMMNYHTSGIFILCGLWIIAIALLGRYLPLKIARVFLLFTLMAHSYGASTWLTMHYGFGSAMLFILFNAILFYKIQDLSSNTKNN
ncbi:hypothetical protein [Saccharicrinis aurantiacus]|uniref:hypothetical protein n=1 Tax=Saccharicrinis aurantiacus TaxID=1849719 RepID=UPI00248FEA6D|nr:hypothetical protein [Saccharicrinis aurantiacus]